MESITDIDVTLHAVLESGNPKTTAVFELSIEEARAYEIARAKKITLENLVNDKLGSLNIPLETFDHLLDKMVDAVAALDVVVKNILLVRLGPAWTIEITENDSPLKVKIEPFTRVLTIFKCPKTCGEGCTSC